ncbi:protein unc-93 homolog A-like [Mytilus galloprovincialis]|uniref:protein unc-93 homolog A-like n=1 Tax=Mytilus galloprovincialis TaxID=29158 RepID=UPI003F7B6CD9
MYNISTMSQRRNETENLEEICLCFRAKRGDSTSGHEIRNTYILSASFFFVFTAYLAIQNLQSSLNQEAGLGVTSLSCLYGFIIISAVLAPTVLKVIGGKLALVIAWILHIVYTLCNFYPTFGTLIPSSILLGLVSGPLWTAQSIYITRNAYSLADRTGKDAHVLLSRLNGIFFTIYELTQISGNLVSSAVLYKSASHSSNASSTTCGVSDCPAISGNATVLDQPSSDVVYTMLGVFLVFDVIGLILTATFLPPLPKSQWTESSSIKESVTSCFFTFGDMKMLLLVPFIAIMAMEQAVLWTDFTKSYVSCPIGIKMVGFIMAAYGGSTTVSALVTSRLAKYTGRQVLFAVAIIIQMSIFVAMFVFYPQGRSDLPYLFIMVVIWGVAEGIWQTQSNALIGYLYPENTEPAFANYHFWKATSFTVYFAISTVLCVKTKLIIVMTLLSVACVLYVALEVKVFFKQRTANISETK